MKKFLSIFVIVSGLLFSAVVADAAVFYRDIRVLISTATYQSMNITVVGDYYVKENPDFDLTADNLSIWVEDDRPVIRSDKEIFSSGKITLISKDYDGTSSTVGFYNAAYGICNYLGNMQFSANEGSIRAINTLPLEHYLYGVVPYEMSNRFPVESLKAQAVCARSYAASKCSVNRDLAYDVVDTIDHQVYLGFSARNARAIEAVNDTSGQVVTSDGAIIQTFYTASNGGQTELTGNVWNENLPYYIIKDDLYDLKNPESLEQKTFIPDEFNTDTLALMDEGVLSLLQAKANQAAGAPVTLISAVRLNAYAPLFASPSRSFSKADIVLFVSDETNKQGQVTVTLDFDSLIHSEDNPYGVFNIRPPYLKMRGAERGFLTDTNLSTSVAGWFLTNRRYGHGVGLSQRGAQQRATSGQDYAGILDFYYEGTDLVMFEPLSVQGLISSKSYTLSDKGVEGVSPGTYSHEFIQDFTADTGKVSLIANNGLAKTEGPVVTGDFVRGVYDDGAAILDMPVIIYGDVSGDGDITKRDLDLIQWHLLDLKPLKDAYWQAADINHDNTVDEIDLLMMIWHLTGAAEISQP